MKRILFEKKEIYKEKNDTYLGLNENKKEKIKFPIPKMLKFFIDIY